MKGNRGLAGPRIVTLYGVTIALVAALTAIAIPIPATRGYFNLGEGIIFFAAFMFGRRAAAICGALGATLIDVIYAPYFIPATLLAKSLEGFVAGSLAWGLKLAASKTTIRTISFLLGGSLMIITYFCYEVFILPLGLSTTGGLAVALAELPWNITQVLVGGTIAILLAEGIERSYPPIKNFAE